MIKMNQNCNKNIAFKYSNLVVDLCLKTFSIISSIILYLFHLKKAYIWFTNLTKPTNTYFTISTCQKERRFI